MPIPVTPRFAELLQKGQQSQSREQMTHTQSATQESNKPTTVVPDPFDKEANSLESLTGPSDIIPEAVYKLTGSELTSFLAGFLSPTQMIKGGAKKVQKLVEGQDVYRWTATPNPEILSRRFEHPGNEFGMHVGTDRSPGEYMSRDYRGFVDESGMLKMKSKVNKPLWLPDTNGGWHPELVVDSIITGRLQGNVKFSDQGLRKLYKEQKTWRDWQDSNEPNWTKELHMQKIEEYTKRVQKIIKEEGYDHISYKNTAEGNLGVESAIIFDRNDVELIK